MKRLMIFSPNTFICSWIGSRARGLDGTERPETWAVERETPGRGERRHTHRGYDSYISSNRASWRPVFLLVKDRVVFRLPMKELLSTSPSPACSMRHSPVLCGPRSSSANRVHMKHNLPWWWAGTCRNILADSHIVLTLAEARNLSAVLRGTVDSQLEHLKLDARFST